MRESGYGSRAYTDLRDCAKKKPCHGSEREGFPEAGRCLHWLQAPDRKLGSCEVPVFMLQEASIPNDEREGCVQQDEALLYGFVPKLTESF